MRTHLIGGRPVSVIGLGTSEFGGRYSEALSFELMDAYWAIGGRFLDTARVYGDFATPVDGKSEEIIGRWMDARRCRGEVFLSTKGGHPPFSNMRASRLSRGEILDDMQKSLEALRVGCVDIYWLHRDDESRPVGEILETLNELVARGMTRLFGVSNWRAERIEAANRCASERGLIPIAASQIQWSLARQATVEDPTLVCMDSETWAMHRRTNLPLVCFSSQGKGFFSKLEQGEEAQLSEKVRLGFWTDENLQKWKRVKALKEETGLSAGAIALAYLTSQPFPTFALAGASKARQVLALAEAGEARLDEAQRTFLDGSRP